MLLKYWVRVFDYFYGSCCVIMKGFNDDSDDSP